MEVWYDRIQVRYNKREAFNLLRVKWLRKQGGVLCLACGKGFVEPLRIKGAPEWIWGFKCPRCGDLETGQEFSEQRRTWKLTGSERMALRRDLLEGKLSKTQISRKYDVTYQLIYYYARSVKDADSVDTEEEGN